MYLHGLSTGDFVPAHSEFFGSGARLNPAVITRLTGQWQGEHRAFITRTCPSGTVSTTGPTESTPTFASRRTGCVAW